MVKKQDSVVSGKVQDKRQLTQNIIHEMKAQGILEDYVDAETGKALLEIQFSDQTVLCNIDAGEVIPD